MFLQLGIIGDLSNKVFLSSCLEYLACSSKFGSPSKVTLLNWTHTFHFCIYKTSDYLWLIILYLGFLGKIQKNIHCTKINCKKRRWIFSPTISMDIEGKVFAISCTKIVSKLTEIILNVFNASGSSNNEMKYL